MSKYYSIFLLLLILFVVTCKNENVDQYNYYHPKIGDTFEWRLDSIPFSDVANYHCTIIDIDAFRATPELVQSFHARGIKVIAYISVGTIENFRDDSDLLPSEIIGNIYPSWPDEKFLNIREIDKIRPFILSRFDMIKKKGFDGIEPDNIDGYGEDNGFSLTLEDTKVFCEWIIEEAHQRGLSIGQKNTEELVPFLVDQFDWVLTEDIFANNIQDFYTPYISVGKPVFSAEYTDAMGINDFSNSVCPRSKLLNYYVFLKNRDLTRWEYDCY